MKMQRPGADTSALLVASLMLLEAVGLKLAYPETLEAVIATFVTALIAYAHEH
jgi:hypothetical protein